MESSDQTELWNAQLRAVRGRFAAAGVATLADLRSRSGAQFLDAVGNGELPTPPIGHTLDFWPVEWEPGRIVFQGMPAMAHYNPIGSVHGGWIATLLDSAVGCAVHSVLPAGKGYTTVELKVNFVRAVTADVGPLRAEGKVIHVGAQIGTAEARLFDARGKLYAHATTTCLVFRLPAERS
ncbi:MAG: PaaI family thioesterase [Proteobacteria bacterium]|nr:MAG: PaaI family thioesterase [Pseudomonadota bacterium]